MKKHLLLIPALWLTQTSLAQDQIFKSDNTKILAKIVEVSPEEIKYKLFDNLNGPMYVTSKKEVSLIIYENGQHEIINRSPAAPQAQAPVVYQPAPAGRNAPTSYSRARGMSKEDSLLYFNKSNSLSLNFLTFMNMELGLVYQKDFLKSNFNIIIPLAVGIQTPGVTQTVYFNSNNSGFNNSFYNSYNYGQVNLNRKLFEVGFGINYYPSLKHAVNYYIGPAFRYMQYECQQTYYAFVPGVYNPSTGMSTPSQYLTLTKNSTLSRYTMSITNGLIFRTRSRLMVNMFGSIGFKNDELNNSIQDPVTSKDVRTIAQPFSLYFWTGFMVGFTF